MQINLPVPRPGVPGDLPKYPFDKLAIGDSFVVPYQRAGIVTVQEMVRRRNNKGKGTFRVAPGDKGNTLVERIA